MPEHIVKMAFVHREGGKATLYEPAEKKQMLSVAAAEHAAAHGYIDAPKAKADAPAKPTQPDGQANA